MAGINNNNKINKKMAIITGIQGQDGSYLADLLLGIGYTVIGIARRKAIEEEKANFRIQHLLGNDNTDLIIEKGDITDAGFISRLLLKWKPAEYYNLAAMSFVHESWNTPATTIEINHVAIIHALEAIRNLSPKTKFLQASSSEMYGDNPNPPFDEKSKFYPRSPYALSKVASHQMVKVYRESYDLFACCSICHNHESERRGEEFVTQKIARGVARIKQGLQKKIILGNLDVERDWGYAKDYVEGMYLMLQQDLPEDYVFASGESHSIREFLKFAFLYVGIKNWQDYIEIDKKLIRPAEVNKLYGDASKAKEKLGWQPKVNFKTLIRIMIERQIEKLRSHTISPSKT